VERSTCNEELEDDEESPERTPRVLGDGGRIGGV